MESVTCERAAEIAVRSARKQGWDTSAPEAERWSDLGREPAFYRTWEGPCDRLWVVRFPERPAVRLQASRIVVVHDMTGEVLYVGSACDEG